MIDAIKNLLKGIQFLVVVAPWEQGVRVRLGRRVKLLGAGWYWRLPFLDRVFIQTARRRLSVIRAQTVSTVDGVIVTVGGAVGYEILDLLKLYHTLESPEGTIETEVASIVADYIGSHRSEDCSSVGLEKFVSGKLDLARYGLGSQEYRVTSFAAAKAYRFITGEIPSWNSDRGLSMTPTD